MIRVRLSLPFPALEAGVRALLSEDPEIQIVSSADDSEAVDVQIVTSTASLRHGALAERDSTVGVIVIGAENLEPDELAMGESSWGVLPMEVSSQELCAAVYAVAAGLIVGTRQLLLMPDAAHTAPGPLTEREVEILAMLSRGLANKQVAAELGISEHTVKFHVSSIYTKLNVANRTEAVREGLRNGWIAL